MDIERDEGLLNTNDLAKWLGIAPRTICTWADSCGLPAIKVGRQWRFRRSAIKAWLSAMENSHERERLEAAGHASNKAVTQRAARAMGAHG